jgi:hypothetical protein
MAGAVFGCGLDPGEILHDFGAFMVAEGSEDPPLDRDDRQEHPASRRSPYSEHDLHAQRKWRVSLEAELHKKDLQRVAQYGVANDFSLDTVQGEQEAARA